MAALLCASRTCSASLFACRIATGESPNSRQWKGPEQLTGRLGPLQTKSTPVSQRRNATCPRRSLQQEAVQPFGCVASCSSQADKSTSELNANSELGNGETAQQTGSGPKRVVEKEYPSRRDLFFLTGAAGLAITGPANAEESAAPAVETTSALPPPETQTAPPPSEPQTPAPSTTLRGPPPPVEAPKEPPAAKKVEPPKPAGPNTTVTARAYLDVMLCPGGTSRSERTLGDSNNICTAESGGQMLGRIVIGLYGKQVPRTVANFIAMVTGAAGSTYKGTLFHKIIEGQYVLAGKQGSRSEGHVLAPSNLEKNPETVKSSSFALPHRRPGTVSLCLGVNDDEEDRKLSQDYRNVEFLITTGPAPASDLDGSNIVFGTVLEGMDVVSKIAAIPSYKPNIRIKQFNEFAEFLGDERAETARKFWDRPLQNVVIAGCGIIQPKPSPLPNGQP